MVDNGGAVGAPVSGPVVVSGAEVFEAFLDDCRFRGLSQETIRKYQVHGRRFLRHLEAEGLAWPPAASVVDDNEPAVPRMRIRTRLFRHHTPEGAEVDADVALLDHGLSLRGLAKVIGVAYGTVFGARFGRWGIGQTFVERAVAAFEGRYTYEELFYEVQE